MSFSKAKLRAIRPQKELLLNTFLTAILVAAAFFLPYMFFSEGYFTFYGDFNVQQIPFYRSCNQAIKDGNIFWSQTTDLGANFIGSYSFYLLGSPFFWITLLFPASFVPYLMGPLLILKFSLAATTAYMYIRRFTRTPEAAKLGGLLYAFSGFSVYNIFFNHFHEAIIVFPLLLLSLELLITENRRFFFAFMVFLCCFINYFFFFGMVVFTVIYFFVRLFSSAIKISPKLFFVMIFEAVLGVMLSAVLLLPSILAIIGNSRISDTLLGWDAMMYGKEQIYANVLQCFFFPPDIPARPVFFPGANVKWSSLGGWLPLFSTVGLFTFFSKKKGHWLKRVIGICIFMSMVPILNSTFYACNSAYYARWFYMPVLMICLATVMLTEDLNTDWSMGWNWVFGITLAVSCVIGFFPQKNKDGDIIFGLYTQGSNSSDTQMYMWRFFGACAIALLSLLALRFIINTVKTNPKKFYKIATAAVCVITVIYANVFIACGRSHSYDTKNVVIDQLIEGKVNLGDGDEYFRIDNYNGVDNVSMYLGYPGINAFHSIVPASITEFYEYIGVDRGVGSRPGKEVYAIRPLLSVKYLLDSVEKENNPFYDEDDSIYAMPGYSYLETQNKYYIYENKNYIPMGFSYDYYMTDDYCKMYEEESRANMMLKAILLTDSQISEYGHMFNDLSDITDRNSSDERTTVSLSDISFEYDCKKLAETSAKSFVTDNKGFTAEVSREKETLVFFSVPYDEGWSATVNGKPAKIEKVNVGFMAVAVPKGESTIRFNYSTPGLAEGLMITAAAVLIFLFYVIIMRNRAKPLPLSEYPEGKALLTDWRSQELNELTLMALLKAEKDEEASDTVNTFDEDSVLPVKTEESGNTNEVIREIDNGFKVDLDAFKDN